LPDVCCLHSIDPCCGLTDYKHVFNYHHLIHDTIGLNDVKGPKVALTDLDRLICDARGGISLLVYVHRDRMAAHKIKYYKHFQQAVCQGQVPTVLVQTGLEGEENVDEWWRTHEQDFKDQGIQTQYHACITSTKGKYNANFDRYVYQEEYDSSVDILRSVIYDATLQIPWNASNTPKLMEKPLNINPIL
jgi:hypothetical protein